MAYANTATITIDNTKVSGSSNFTNIPILISGTYAGSGNDPDLRTTGNGGDVQNANGYDIAFFSDESLTTQLDHHVLKYSATTGEIVARVEIPTLSYNSDTVIYIGYNDSGISTSQENITGTYSSGFKYYYPFDPGYSGTDQLLDATSNNNDLTNSSTTENTSGKVASSRDDAGNQYLYTGSTSTQMTTTVAIKAWVKFDNAPVSSSVIVASRNRSGGSGTNDGEFSLRFDSDGKMLFYYYDDSGTPANHTLRTDSALTYSTGTWYPVFVEYTYGTTSSLIFKFNETDYASSSSWVLGDGTGSAGTFSNKLQIGIERFDSTPLYNSEPFEVDDIMIHEGTLGSDWATTMYNNENSPSTFYSITTAAAGSTFIPKIIIY